MAVKTVKMYHNNPAVTGGPTVADVPQASVHDWERNGWSLLPFNGKAKAGATLTMYRPAPNADGVVITAEVPEASVHCFEAEGWSSCPF